MAMTVEARGVAMPDWLSLALAAAAAAPADRVLASLDSSLDQALSRTSASRWRRTSFFSRTGCTRYRM